MEIGLFAESAGLPDLERTLERAAALGTWRIELATGGQCEQPFLIKDVTLHRHNLALVGLLDNRPDVSFRERPWNFCTPGFGHDAGRWREFVVALNDVGYDDVASIENEEPYLPGFAGVERTVALLREVL